MAESDEEEVLSRNVELFQIATNRSDVTLKLSKIRNLLLNNKANIDFQDANRKDNTLLHTAIQLNNTELIKFLLDAGARVYLPNRDGKTPKQLAAELERSKSLIDLLSEKESDVECDSDYFVTRKPCIYQERNFQQTDDNVVINWQEYFDFLQPESMVLSKLKHSKIKVLNLLNCRSTSTALEFLSNNFFSTLNKLSYLFLINIEVDVGQKITKADVDAFLPAIDKERPLIIQLISKKLEDSVICYKEPDKDFVVVKFDDLENVNDEEYITMSETFDFSMLLTMLKSGMGGEYTGNILNCSLEIERNFDDWRIVDYAAKSNDMLSLRFLFLIEKWELSKTNEYGNRLLEIAVEYADAKTLSAILNFPFIIPDGELSISERQKYVLNLKSGEDETPLMISAGKGKFDDTFQLLIRLGCGSEDGHQSAIDAAWKRENYARVVFLLNFDAGFPSSFEEDLHGHKDLEDLCQQRNLFHEAIKNSNETEILTFRQANVNLKKAFNTNGKSALYTALDSKKFEIFALLQSQGFEEDMAVLNLREALRNEERVKLKHANAEYFGSVDKSHILHVFSKSRLALGQSKPEFHKKIFDFYQKLDDIPNISLVLRVIENSDSLTIIFDFEHDSVVYMDPTLNSSETKGSCDYRTGRLYISAKRSEDDELLGTLAHELTHLAMQIRYNNECNPYDLIDNDEKTEFLQIASDMEKINDVDDIIKRVYTVYKKPEWSSELIVRINHILTQYPNDVIARLENAERLIDWYEKHITPSFQSFIKNPNLYKYENRVQYLNLENDILINLQNLASSVLLKESRLYCFDLPTKHLFIIETNYSKLPLLNLYQTFIKEAKSLVALGKNKLFINSLKLKNDQSANIIFDVMQAVLNKYLIVDCTNSMETDYIIATINSLHFKNNVILIVRSDLTEELEKGIKYDFKKVVKDNEYTFNDFTLEGKTYLLGKKIIFQGYSILLRNILDKDSPVARYIPLRTLLEGEETLNIGTVLTSPVDYDQDLYIERSFIHATTVKENIFVEASADVITTSYADFEGSCLMNNNKNTHLLLKKGNKWIWEKSNGKIANLRPYLDDETCNNLKTESIFEYARQRKIILISDVAGMGKSTVVAHMSKRIKEINKKFWVLRIELNEYTDILKKYNDDKFTDFDVKRVVEILSLNFLNLSTPFQIELFREACLCERSLIKIIIFFDGLDEVSPTYKQLMLFVLKSLEKTCIEQLWITTRPHLIEELEDLFSTIRFTLKPFEKQNQIDFLKLFWRKRLNIEPSVSVIDQYSIELVEKVLKSLRENGDKIVGMPLQTRLLAEVYEKDVKHLVDTKSMSFTIPDNFELAELFELFIRKKFEIYQVLKVKAKTSVVAAIEQSNAYFEYIKKAHQILALNVIFGDDKHLELKAQKIVTEFSSEEISRIGLATVKKDAVFFINHTFAEFYVAQFFITKLKKGRAISLRIQDFFLRQVFILKEHQIIRTFLNSMFVKVQINLNSNNVSTYWQNLDDIDPHYQMMVTLVQENNVQITDFVLTAVHTSEKYQLLKSMLTKEYLWEIASLNGNIDMLKTLFKWVKSANLPCLDLKVVFPNIYIAGGQNGNIDVLNLAKTYSENMNMPAERYRFCLILAWRNAAKGGHVEVMEGLYRWSIEGEHTENKFEFLLDGTTWKNSASFGHLHILEKLKNWDEIVKLNDEQMSNILLDSILWQSAAERGQISCLELLWKWCRDLNFSEEQYKELLLDEGVWWNTAKNGHIIVLKALCQWSLQVGLSHDDLKAILKDEEVWQGGNLELQKSLWELVPVLNFNTEEYQDLFRSILNGATSEKHNEVTKKLLNLGANIINKENDLHNMMLLSWQDACFSQNIYSLDFLWQIMKQNMSINDIKTVLLNSISWKDIVKETRLLALEKCWSRCAEIGLTVDEFQETLKISWRSSAAFGHLIIFEDIWDYVNEKLEVVQAPIVNNVNESNNESSIGPIEFNESCLEDKSWWREVFDNKRDVIKLLLNWADGLKLLDVICNLLITGTSIGNSEIDEKFLQHDRQVDTSKPNFKEMFLQEWQKLNHVKQVYGYQCLRDWWSKLKTDPKFLENFSAEAQLRIFRNTHGFIMNIVRKCGERLNMNSNFLVDILIDKETWRETAFIGQIGVLKKLYAWQMEHGVPVDDKKICIEQAIQGAMDNANLLLAVRLLKKGESFGITGKYQFFKNAWKFSTMSGNVTAVMRLWEHKAYFDVNEEENITLLTNMEVWENAAKKGYYLLMNALWHLKKNEQISEFRSILENKNVWEIYFKDGLIQLWKWYHEAECCPENLNTIIINTWKYALSNCHDYLLDDIWNWGSQKNISTDCFFKILNELIEDKVILDLIKKNGQVIKTLRKLWKAQELPENLMTLINLDEAVEIAHEALFSNHGQSCCAGSRTFVQAEIYDQFVGKAKDLAAKRVVGDPFTKGVQQGPQIDRDQFDKILSLIKSYMDKGAKVECGGDRLGNRGYFVQQTVFSNVQNNMRIAKEEACEQ